MVYMFEFFKFSILLTWIFETISRIISNEICKFHVCVEGLIDNSRSTPLSSVSHSSWFIVRSSDLSNLFSRKESMGAMVTASANHYLSCGHAWLMRRFADSEWHSHNAIELQTHPITILRVGKLKRRLSKLAKRQPWTTHPEFSSQARLWDHPTHLEAAPHNHENLRFRWRGSCWLSQRSTSAKYESGEIEKYRPRSF